MAVAATSIVLAAAVYIVAVRTSAGQLVDQRLFEIVRSLNPVSEVPYELSIDIVTSPTLWLSVAAAVTALACVGALIARGRITRGHLLATLALLAYVPIVIGVVRFLRDHVLERPQLHDWITDAGNSAPSGHAAAVAAIVVALVLASPTIIRPWVAALAGTWAVVIDFQLVASGWHRPSDVMISTLLVIGCAALLPRITARTSGATVPLAGLGAALIVIAAPIAVAIYFPAPSAIVVSGGFALVLAALTWLSLLAGGSGVLTRRPGTIPLSQPHRSPAGV
ncbi:hypothetical protein GS4_23_00060 [Gordonia soli NBRC 108243]|uniref:Phosphatidic acid phosphatase type 2/haloperoxidase domain-containing protein n=1 Tax=Gordonia soli NBRC 108243 TaxID=1223545 RepID=M0QP41_9ACTN|nr:hypothetical protein GS4_23_00060 [Gordonia soli NBRC 108243]